MSGGAATALALAGGFGDLGEAADEQLDLIEAEAPLPLEPAKRGASGPKGGRPAGARNKSTEAWRQFVLGRYKSPLVGLAEVWTRSAEAFARELQLFARDADGNVLRGADGRELLAPGAVVEAFKLQQQAMTAALPFLHSRQPIGLEVTQRELGVLVIQQGEPAQVNGVALPIMEIEENQHVSDPGERMSDGALSDDVGNQ